MELLRIEALAHGGDGVATLPSGKKIFVPGTAPGDLVRAELVSDKGAHARGRMVELVEPSPERVAAPCPHVERCGGCPLQHLSMRAQLDATTLKTIADSTDGEYYEATSATDLAEVYKSLSTRLISEKKLTEIAFLFAGVGGLLAAMAAGLSLWWFGRIA